MILHQYNENYKNIHENIFGCTCKLSRVTRRIQYPPNYYETLRRVSNRLN